MVHEDINLPITVLKVVTETPDYLSVYFDRPRGFIFEPGDWMDINTLTDQPFGGTTYSFASSPNEPALRITFRRGLSPYKLLLGSLQAGDKLQITEYGNDYGFKPKEHQASILIAGGVGIAPFRSMIKEMAEKGSNNEVLLIYLNTTNDFLFRRDFDEWQTQLAGLQVQYIVTKELKRKDRENLIKELLPDFDRQFYVSGPSGMVTNTVGLLEKFDVDKKNIKVDDFGQY